MHPLLRARAVTTYLAVLIGLVAAALVATGAWVPAGAHTEVLRASPGPGERVPPPVDAIELTFLDPVRPDVTIEVLDLLGEPVAGLGPVEVSDDRRSATVSFAPLSDPGDYTVEYRFTAEDGDVQREAYQFTITPRDDDAGGGDADEPVTSDGGTGPGALVGAAVVAAVVLVGAGVALRRRRVRNPSRIFREDGGQRALDSEE